MTMVPSDGADSQSAGDWKRRLVYPRRLTRWESFRLRLWYASADLGWRIWSSVWRVTGGRWLFIKQVYIRGTSEADALNFVRQHTTVPVPRVLCHVQWWGAEYIVMTRCPGETLAVAWNNLDEEARQSIVAQLRNYVLQLRSLRSPFGKRICSVVQGPINDGRLSFSEAIGPFTDEAHMNMQLGYPRQEDLTPEDAELYSKHHGILFTHGDLAKRNIMVRGCAVTAIVDWESAGWFPEHWEYVKAHFGDSTESWKPWIARFIPPYDDEVEADNRVFAITWIPTWRVEPGVNCLMG